MPKAFFTSYMPWIFLPKRSSANCWWISMYITAGRSKQIHEAFLITWTWEHINLNSPGTRSKWAWNHCFSWCPSCLLCVPERASQGKLIPIDFWTLSIATCVNMLSSRPLTPQRCAAFLTGFPFKSCHSVWHQLIIATSTISGWKGVSVLLCDTKSSLRVFKICCGSSWCRRFSNFWQRTFHGFWTDPCARRWAQYRQNTSKSSFVVVISSCSGGGQMSLLNPTLCGVSCQSHTVAPSEIKISSSWRGKKQATSQLLRLYSHSSWKTWDLENHGSFFSILDNFQARGMSLLDAKRA